MQVRSGDPVEVGGWYLDEHRHRLLLRRDDPAPVCPRIGPLAVTWRLVVPLPVSRR